MANKQRGEVTLKVGGTSYTLRPEFGVVAEIEDVLSENMFKIGQRLETVDYTATGLLDVIAAFLVANGHEVKPDAIKVALVEQGAFIVIAILTEFCRAYAFGGAQEKKEAETPSSETETESNLETLPVAS